MELFLFIINLLQLMGGSLPSCQALNSVELLYFYRFLLLCQY